jgi:AAA+ superfamily predicted ATPase
MGSGYVFAVIRPSRTTPLTSDLSRLQHASRVFELTPAELSVLTVLFAAEAGPQEQLRSLRVGDVVARLEGAHERLDVLAALSSSGALAQQALVAVRGEEAFLDRRVSLVEEMWARLLGVPAASSARPGAPVHSLALTPVVLERVDAVARWLAESKVTWPTVIVYGPSDTGRAAIAEGLAATLGCDVLPIDGASLTPSNVPTLRREIAWHQAIPIISCADRAEAGALSMLARVAACPIFVTASTPVTEAVMTDTRAVRVLEIDPLGVHERAAIWGARFAERAIDVTGIDCVELASRFRFGPARIAAAVSTFPRGSSPPQSEVIELCRTVHKVHAGGLASLVRHCIGWNALVAPDATSMELDLIVTWERRRAHLFGPGMIGANARASKGLTCLFWGPPGTGKTLAAQLIAGELGRELYRVDLSQVVDKYIGETEKRLDLVLREAEQAGVVLLFDEADALFAQRTNVRSSNDRYANLETGFLLQRIENHDGLVLLASNLRGNLDPAFQRRLGVTVEFPMPEVPERRRIWDLLLPQREHRHESIDLDRLAQLSEHLSGGDIRNAVVTSVLFADQRREPLAMRHVVLALMRELRRMGRLVDVSRFAAPSIQSVTSTTAPVLPSM